jgi:hypothetical protein
VTGTRNSPAITAKTTVNHIPVVDVGDQITLPPGVTSVVLQATATDQDSGDTLTYTWRQITGPTGAGTATGMPATSLNVVVSNLMAGTYQFGFRATDQVGAQSAEDYIVVTVQATTSSGAQTVDITTDMFTQNVANEQANGYQRCSALATLPQFMVTGALSLSIK